jgi:polyhydroxyalkanoate synthase
MRGTLTVGGRPARPAALRMPVLAVAARRNPVVAPGSILPFLAAVPCRDKRLLWYAGDRGVALQHVGSLIGAGAHRRLWPQILRWLSPPR